MIQCPRIPSIGSGMLPQLQPLRNLALSRHQDTDASAFNSVLPQGKQPRPTPVDDDLLPPHRVQGERDGLLRRDEVRHARVLHAVVAQLAPSALLCQPDRVQARPRLALEASIASSMPIIIILEPNMASLGP